MIKNSALRALPTEPSHPATRLSAPALTPTWAERPLTAEEIASSHPATLDARYRIDSDGVPRRIDSSDHQIIYHQTQRPLIGGRNTLLDRLGIHVLATGEGSLRSFACTQANTGFVEFFDWAVAADLDPASPSDITSLTTPRKIIQMSPPILGQWPLDANFKSGLVVVLSGANHTPILTVVWFLLADMHGGAAPEGKK